MAGLDVIDSLFRVCRMLYGYGDFDGCVLVACVGVDFLVGAWY